MYTRFLMGLSLRLSYEGIFRIFTYVPMLKRILLIAFTAGLINPFNWMLRDHPLFTFMMVPTTVILIGIFYVCFFQLLLMIASVTKRSVVYEPLAMLLAFVMSFPAVYFALLYVPFGGPVPVVTLLGAFVFAYCGAQLGMVFYLVPHIVENIGDELDDNAPNFFHTERKEGFYLGEHQVLFEQLLWIRSEGHNLRVKMKSQEIVVRAPLSKILGLLDSIDGLLIHRSSWVSRQAVSNIDRSFGSVALVTTDGMRHSIARAKVSKVKTWISGEVVALADETNRAGDIPVRFLLFGDYYTTLADFMETLVRVDKFVLASITALVLLMFNPVHYTETLPVTYWAIFWTLTAISFYIIYPGLISMTGMLVQVFELKAVHEFPVMILAHFVAYMVITPVGEYVSLFYGEKFTYPISAVIFNVAVGELVVSYVKMGWNRDYSIRKEQEKNGTTEKNTSIFGKTLDDANLQFSILDKTFNVRDVYYVQSEGHYLRVHLQNGEEFLSGKLSNVLDQLPTPYAFSPHRSYWIMRHAVRAAVQSDGRLKLKLINGDIINVARGKLPETRIWLAQIKMPITRK